MLTADPTDTGLHGIRAEVSVLIPAPVLTGDDGAPVAGVEAAVARLANGAPIDPETARILASRASSWARLFTDPLTGQVLAVDTYTPSSQLKRLLRARDQHCRWPGCGQRARRCDIDHTKPWAEGGTTCHDNLAHLCRRHHTLKGAQLAHARRWKVRQTSPGVLEFTSPTGDVYTDEPPHVGPVFVDASVEHWGERRADSDAPSPF
ncbi:HNH endonuclease signature motif containing protein [Agrococcus carbonis]|uniref:HNH endonuclease signature motif containing protein n=1 Tax=Agrococcus carbonis TaxID=684552 RepID=UPI000B89C01F|nr:HNH endonuclease signature motif containing protein [Agrococcus carbonis]